MASNINMICVFLLDPGKEQWMDQARRYALVKKFDEGIIDLNATEYDK